MQQLTSEGQQKVTELAQRYGVSTEAVLTLLHALVHGHGTMAQFDHRELGGRGQWMPGGMVMVGDMFNQALKATVDGLCTELVSLLAASLLVQDAAARVPCQTRTRRLSNEAACVQQLGAMRQPLSACLWRRQQETQERGGQQSSAYRQRAARKTPCATPIFLRSAVWPLPSTGTSVSMTRSIIR